MQHRTTEQILSDIQVLKKALNVPNLPADEASMHTQLLQALEAELDKRSDNREAFQRVTKATMSDQPAFTVRAKFVNTDAPIAGMDSKLPGPQLKSRTILAGGMSQTKESISATIQAEANTDPHNPRITITWEDGYQIIVDETAATGRFKSTLRDCTALKCVSDGRFNKIWRWDSAWRCAGFYQALTQFWGKAPSLKDLGVSHPTDKQRLVFDMITNQKS